MSGRPVSSHDGVSMREQFEFARIEAVRLTDRYNCLKPGDSDRSAAWARAMEQTEVARQLLEAWLRDDSVAREPERILSPGGA